MDVPDGTNRRDPVAERGHRNCGMAHIPADAIVRHAYPAFRAWIFQKNIYAKRNKFIFSPVIDGLSLCNTRMGAVMVHVRPDMDETVGIAIHKYIFYPEFISFRHVFHKFYNNIYKRVSRAVYIK